MKKIVFIKFILLTILSFFLFYETFYSYNKSDPWGLTFAFTTIPLAILSIIAVYQALKSLKIIIKGQYDNLELKKTGYIYIYLIVLVIVLITGTRINIFYNKANNDTKTNSIPEGYIAVFNGGVGEITYSTYLYKNQNNNEYKYINTTNTTTSYGSPNWNIKITSEGTFFKLQDIFAIAEKNNAYSFIQIPNDDKIYSVQEYKAMVLLK